MMTYKIADKVLKLSYQADAETISEQIEIIEGICLKMGWDFSYDALGDMTIKFAKDDFDLFDFCIIQNL